MNRRLIAALMTATAFVSWNTIAGVNPHITELDLSIDGVADDQEYFEPDPGTPSPNPPTPTPPQGPGGFICSNGWKKIKLKATGSDPMKTRLNLCSAKIEIWTATNGGAKVTCPILYDPASSMPTQLWVKGVAVSDYGPGTNTLGQWTNCGPEHITLEAINNGDLPTTPGTYYDHIAFTVINVEVTNIKFNHDTASSANDAINIRKDYNTVFDISNGEWVKGGTNIPICYTTNKAVTIKARFTVQPASITSADIWALSTDSGGSLGDVIKTNVTFVSGVASDVVFQVSGTTTNCIQKTTTDVWQWKINNVNGYSSSECDLNKSGVHTVYTILNEPVAPWINTANNATNAWVSALDLVCGPSPWAGGCTTIEDAAARVTKQIYNSNRFSYDFPGGGDCHYTHFIFGVVQYFALSEWIDRLTGGAGGNAPVNCWDCANGVVSLANVVGCDLWNQWMGSGFNCNEIRAITDNPWGRPFGWGFGYHRVGWRGAVDDSGRVFDACLKVDNDADPTGIGNHSAEIIPTDITFWTVGGVFDDYKKKLVDPGDYGNCNVANAGTNQDPGQRRDPIR